VDLSHYAKVVRINTCLMILCLATSFAGCSTVSDGKTRLRGGGVETYIDDGVKLRIKPRPGAVYFKLTVES
jgi:hypothetical protein